MTSGPEPIDRHHTLGNYVGDLPNAVTFCGLLAGLGALPFASLKLADMGAEVVRVDRLSEVPENPEPRPHNFWDRGRRSIALDLKDPRGVDTVLRLVDGADVFLEAFGQ